METIAAVMVSDLGAILSYTCQNTKQQCEEFCIEFFGKETFEELIARGAVIKQVKITVL